MTYINDLHPRKMNPMHFFRTVGILLIGFCTLTAASRPVGAQELTATLTGITFSDGAIATGYFNYNPTTHTLGSFDITTTNGVTDTLTGGHYAPGPGTVTFSNDDFSFYFTTPELAPDFSHNSLALDASNYITSTGVYSLHFGTDVTATGFGGSGEFAPAGIGARGITAGTLVVTDAVPAPVPEASTTVSFGLLLALGMGGLVIARRKKMNQEEATPQL